MEKAAQPAARKRRLGLSPAGRERSHAHAGATSAERHPPQQVPAPGDRATTGQTNPQAGRRPRANAARTPPDTPTAPPSALRARLGPAANLAERVKRPRHPRINPALHIEQIPRLMHKRLRILKPTVKRRSHAHQKPPARPGTNKNPPPTSPTGVRSKPRPKRSAHGSQNPHQQPLQSRSHLSHRPSNQNRPRTPTRRQPRHRPSPRKSRRLVPALALGAFRP